MFLDEWIFEEYKHLAHNPMYPEFKTPTYVINFDVRLQPFAVRKAYNQMLGSIAENTPLLQYPNGEISPKTSEELLYAKEIELDETLKRGGFVSDFLIDAQRETLWLFC